MNTLKDQTVNVTKEDLIDEAELNRTHIRWFNSLFTTIKKDLNEGHGFQANTLAEIGQYLTEDLGYYKDLELEKLNKTKH